jgi:hypothetical protein
MNRRVEDRIPAARLSFFFFERVQLRRTVFALSISQFRKLSKSIWRIERQYASAKNSRRGPCRKCSVSE